MLIFHGASYCKVHLDALAAKEALKELLQIAHGALELLKVPIAPAELRTLTKPAQPEAAKLSSTLKALAESTLARLRQGVTHHSLNGLMNVGTLFSGDLTV